jgi:hypothetical protein
MWKTTFYIWTNGWLLNNCFYVWHCFKELCTCHDGWLLLHLLDKNKKGMLTLPLPPHLLLASSEINIYCT